MFSSLCTTRGRLIFLATVCFTINAAFASAADPELESAAQDCTRLRQKALAAWNEAFGVAEEEREKVLRTLRATCQLEQSTLDRARTLQASVEKLAELATGDDVKVPEMTLREILRELNALLKRGEDVREILSISAEIERSPLEGLPEGGNNAQRLLGLYRKIRTEVERLQMEACKRGEDFSPQNFLQTLEVQLSHVQTVYKQAIINTALPLIEYAVAAGTPTDSRPNDTIETVGDIPIGGYVDTTELHRNQEAYLQDPIIAVISFDRILVLFNAVFPNGEPLSSASPGYLDPQQLMDYSSIDFQAGTNEGALRQARLTIPEAQASLQKLVQTCATAGDNTYTLELRYNVKRTLRYLEENPVCFELRNRVLLALVSAGNFCVTGIHQAAAFLNVMAFQGRDPIASPLPRDLISQIDTTLYDLREEVFAHATNFYGDLHPGHTSNNYRLRFARQLRIREGNKASPLDENGLGYRGRAVRDAGNVLETYPSSHPEDDLFSASAPLFLSRFFYGKGTDELTDQLYQRSMQAIAHQVGVVSGITERPEERIIAEIRRTYRGYTPQEMLMRVMKRINQPTTIERGEESLVAEALSYLADRLTEGERSKFQQWAVAHLDIACRGLDTEENESLLRDVILNPSDAQKKFITEQLYFAFTPDRDFSGNALRSKLKIRSCGVLQLLNLRGHILMGDPPLYLFREIADSLSRESGFVSLQMCAEAVEGRCGRTSENALVVKRFALKRLGTTINYIVPLLPKEPGADFLGITYMLIDTLPNNKELSHSLGSPLTRIEIEFIKRFFEKKAREMERLGVQRDAARRHAPAGGVYRGPPLPPLPAPRVLVAGEGREALGVAHPVAAPDRALR